MIYALFACYAGLLVCLIGMMSCLPGIAKQQRERKEEIGGFTPYHPKKGKYRRINEFKRGSVPSQV